jgi:hypothetical protein
MWDRKKDERAAVDDVNSTKGFGGKKQEMTGLQALLSWC